MTGEILRGPVPSSIIGIPFAPIARYILFLMVLYMFIPEELDIRIAARDRRLDLEDIRDLSRIAALVPYSNQPDAARYHAIVQRFMLCARDPIVDPPAEAIIASRAQHIGTNGGERILGDPGIARTANVTLIANGLPLDVGRQAAPAHACFAMVAGVPPSPVP